MLWWLEQQDESQSALPILDLLAWERSINRLDGESVELYSLRIKHAVANSEDAGFGIGMERIFKRLGFGYIEINERVAGFDWDMVEIAMIEDEFTANQDLVKELIRQYGRTCRRYFLRALITVDAYSAFGLVELDKEVVGVSIEDEFDIYQSLIDELITSNGAAWWHCFLADLMPDDCVLSFGLIEFDKEVAQ